MHSNVLLKSQNLVGAEVDANGINSLCPREVVEDFRHRLSPSFDI